MAATASSAGEIRATLAAILANQGMLIDEEKKKEILSSCNILIKLDSGEFQSLCTNLVKKIDSLTSAKTRIRVPTKKRALYWRRYHQACAGNIKEVWKEFTTKSKINTDPHVEQEVNLLLFQPRLKQAMAGSSSTSGTSSTDNCTLPELSKDELNALVYVSGYVPCKILRKYERMKKCTPTHAMYIECLGNMAVVGLDSSLPAYAREWFDMINRGGPFPVNEPSYEFFTLVERLVRSELPRLLLPTRSDSTTKEAVLEKIMTNEDIQFQWSILSIDIEEEEDGTKLLHEIVTLWLTIRGFSQAAAWMEILKREESEAKRRSKAHRKGLKRKLEEEGGKELEHEL